MHSSTFNEREHNMAHDQDVDLQDLSDGENREEEELEAMQHMPVEERRKALRRLRNRESARRVRARRLAELSQMGGQVQHLFDDNINLKSQVSQLQGHIQAMTVKIYEVTAKYEAAVAENIRLKTELHHVGASQRSPYASTENAFAPPKNLRQLANTFDTLGLATTEGNAMQQQLSGGHTLGSAHCSGQQVQNSDQQHAMDEVVWLLQEHRRRSELAKIRQEKGGQTTADAQSSSLTTESTHSDMFGSMAYGGMDTSVPTPNRRSIDQPMANQSLEANVDSSAANNNRRFSIDQQLAVLQARDNSVAAAAAALAMKIEPGSQQQQQLQVAPGGSSALLALPGTSTAVPPSLNANPSLNFRMPLPLQCFAPGPQFSLAQAAQAAAAARATRHLSIDNNAQQGSHGEVALSWPQNVNNGGGKMDDLFTEFDDLVMPQDL